MKIKQIPISEIIADKEIMARDQIDSEYVVNLTEDIKRGDKLPPVDLFFDEKKYYLADGFHRYEVVKRTDQGTIKANIRNGNKRDAMLFSCGVNSTHGLRRTNADKRKVVERLLNDPEWKEWSDSKIAKCCAVSQPFVSKDRKNLT